MSKRAGIYLLFVAAVAAGVFWIGLQPAPVVAVEDPYAESTKTKVGDTAPAFELAALDGRTIKSEDWKGKVGVLTFFATWCGPCRAELPHLQQDVWEAYKDDPFAMLVVGREHTNAELGDFIAQNKYTFPLAGDPERGVYGKYATKYIPRNYVIGPDGKILYQSVGFNAEAFAEMKQVISDAITDLKQASGPSPAPSSRGAAASAETASGIPGLQSVEVGGEIRVRANHYSKD